MGSAGNKQEDLRKKAEAKLEKVESFNENSLEQANSLLYELRVHQEELMMQNQDLQEMQEQLEASRDRYSDLFEYAPVGYFILNSRGVILDINHHGAKLLGQDQAQLKNKPFTLFTKNLKDGQSQFFPFLKKVFESNNKETIELEMKTHQATVFPAQLEGVTLRSEKHDQQQCLITLRDISSEKRTIELQRLTKALQQEKETAQQYLDLAPVIFLVIDRHHRIKMINNAGCKYLGLEREQIIGKNWFENFVAEEDRERVIGEYRHIEKDKIQLDAYFECSLLVADGNKRIFAWNNSELLDEEGKPNGTLSVGEDITDQKNREKAMMESLIRGQENERKRIANDLHDSIQQYLATIKRKMDGFQPVIQANAPEKEEDLCDTKRLLESVITEVKNITYDLQPSTLEDFGLIPSLEDLCDKISQNWELEVQCKHHRINEPIEKSVKEGLFRIAQELLNNALKHAGAKNITLQLIGHQNSLVLMVEDDGSGFDPSANKHGLGMHSISARVKALGGLFEVDSSKGFGTTVIVEAPYFQDQNNVNHK